ncbi:MAG TPA: division/cell wall cluster transcriptional repressor MraZ [Bacteroidales bacterium]|nr:division/cell wall cluster transcriptional repressor MraZ [Bacteroidales bacterium]
MSLTGTYECKLDNKGRVLLPGKLKGDLLAGSDGGFYVKRSVFARCLELWPKPEWDKKLEEINKLNRFVKKNAEFIRRFLAGVRWVDMDNMGRINLPNELITYANITKNITLNGQINILEIWDTEAYETAVDTDDFNFEDLAEEVMGNQNDQS